MFGKGASLFRAIPANVLRGSLESACKESAFVPRDEGSNNPVLPQLVEPYADLRLLTCRDGPFVSERMLIETPAGELISLHVFGRSEAGSGYRMGGSSISRLAFEQVVPGGPPELVGYARGNTTSGGASPEFFESSSEELFICSLDVNGAPACTEPFSTLSSYRGDDGRAAYRLAVEFPAGGGLSIRGDSQYQDQNRRSQVHHHLKMP